MKDLTAKKVCSVGWEIKVLKDSGCHRSELLAVCGLGHARYLLLVMILELVEIIKLEIQPWLVWFIGLNVGLQTKGSLVQFQSQHKPELQARSPGWGPREATTH